MQNHKRSKGGSITLSVVYLIYDIFVREINEGHTLKKGGIRGSKQDSKQSGLKVSNRESVDLNICCR